jgi:peroxiredoxin
MPAAYTVPIPEPFKGADFNLPEPLTGKNRTLKELSGQNGTLLFFICNHCPYVIHILSRLGEIGNEALLKGIGVAAISSNDVARYPQDSQEEMAKLARAQNWKFPYLYDASQEVARSYFAACTPDIVLMDKFGMTYYRGQFDGSRPGNNVEVSGADLLSAIESMLSGQPAPQNQIPGMGCSIKWKPGFSPDY